MERFSYKISLSSRGSRLLQGHSEVKAWFEEISTLKSLRTAQDYVDALAGFCEEIGKSPGDLLRLGKKGGYELMRAWAVRKLRSGSVTAGRIHAIWYGVKSFLEFHKVRVDGEFPLKRRVKYLDRIPTKNELKQILDAAPSLSGKMAIQLIAFSGLRPEDICDLTYASMKRDFEKGVSPCAVYVPQRKSGEVYVTFLAEETINLLKQYFKVRRQKGEEVTDETPILRSQISKKIGGIRRKTLTLKIEQAMRRSGVELRSRLGDKIQRMRPYSLRKYFRSNLTGHAPQEYVEAWMGHNYGLAHVYGGTRDLDPSTVERMRRVYKECQVFLTDLSRGLEESGIVKEAKVEALKSMAKSLLGIDLLEIKVAKEKGLKRELTRDEEIELFESEIKKMRNGERDPQIMVSENELEKHLAEGWQFVSILPSRKILIRKTN